MFETPSIGNFGLQSCVNFIGLAALIRVPFCSCRCHEWWHIHRSCWMFKWRPNHGYLWRAFPQATGECYIANLCLSECLSFLPIRNFHPQTRRYVTRNSICILLVDHCSDPTLGSHPAKRKSWPWTRNYFSVRIEDGGRNGHASYSSKRGGWCHNDRGEVGWRSKEATAIETILLHRNISRRTNCLYQIGVYNGEVLPLLLLSPVWRSLQRYLGQWLSRMRKTKSFPGALCAEPPGSRIDFEVYHAASKGINIPQYLELSTSCRWCFEVKIKRKIGADK